MGSDTYKIIITKYKTIYHYQNGDVKEFVNKETTNNLDSSVDDIIQICNRNYYNSCRRYKKLIKDFNITNDVLNKASEVLSNKGFRTLFSTKYPDYIRDIIIAFINKHPLISYIELIELFGHFGYKARKERYFSRYMKNTCYVGLNKKEQNNILKDLNKLNKEVKRSKDGNIIFEFRDIMVH